MSGILTLIPTSLEELGSLRKESFELLNKACQDFDKNIIVVEDPKPARRRWLHWGLPREAIEQFVYLNEHDQSSVSEDLVASLKSGKNVFVMSDGGIPAFCDPGRMLVYLAHENKIKVTATSFENSLILALALSGFSEGAFHFAGFPPRENHKRKLFFKEAGQSKGTFVFMDTPYRLQRSLADLAEHYSGKAFIAMDLGREEEELVWGDMKQLVNKAYGKREFVAVLQGKTIAKLK